MMTAYDNFVRHSMLPSILQDRAWADVKSNWKNEQIFLLEKGEIVATASVLIRSVLGQTLVYSPRGFVVSPFPEKETSIEPEQYEGVRKKRLMGLLAEMDKYAQSIGAISLKIDPEMARTEEGIALLTEGGFVEQTQEEALIQPKFAAWLDLQKSEEELLAFFSKKTRYNIRLAERKGVTVAMHDAEAIDLFFALHEIMAKRNHIAIRDRDYYKKLMAAYPGTKIFVASHEEEPLAAAIAVPYGDTVWYAYGASSNEKRNLMPNQLMQWTMIQWAKSKHAIRYDFGGFFHVDLEDGLYRFKSGFTGKTQTLELIGEWENVYRPLKHKIVTKLLPLVMNALKRWKRS